MKKWFVLGAIFFTVGIVLISSRPGSSFDEAALEAAIEDRNEATLEWVNYSGEVEELEEDLHNVSIRLEAVERLGANTDNAKQLRQEKSSIQASLNLATYKMEQASATMDHYSDIVEKLEAEKKATGGSGGNTTVFGVLCMGVALCFVFAGVHGLMKTNEPE